ncbi:competence/damage-inducible protein A [Limibacter armeniacum]|uniref:competence/damage-inducible protein A n=1 Tax=Limibacter armeniacum TaxID=466084 RepID=UPI002FE50F0B
MNVYAEIITIGDEILYGQITDTNSQWIGQELGKAGFRIIRKTSIGDTREEILTALKEAEQRADVILTTGGLGPTKDDITKYTFAEYFGTEMTFREEVFENIDRLFKIRGRQLTELNRQQAYVPSNGKVVMNEVGTAPGMWFPKGKKVFVSMPGVPHEMKKMMTDSIIPSLRESFNTPFIYHKMVRTIGIPESSLSQMLEDWELALPEHIKLAYLPRLGQVRLRLTATGPDLDMLKYEVEKQLEQIRPMLGDKMYSEDDLEIEELIAGLLTSRGQKLATAESCTGGLVADRITNLAGASAFFQGGIVAYSNEVKESQLGVNATTLQAHGAVSEETAKEMAENVRLKYGADFGISTTGIAGPTGGTPEKPVGTIWIAYSDKDKTEAKLLQLSSDRLLNINATANAVLKLLWENIR